MEWRGRRREREKRKEKGEKRGEERREKTEIHVVVRGEIAARRRKGRCVPH